MPCSKRMSPHVQAIAALVLRVTSLSDPRTAAVMSPADNGSSFLLLFLALNVSLEICFLLFPQFFLFVFLAGLSIFVASLRYKWWPSGDLLYIHFFFWQTNSEYAFQPPSMQATYGTRTLNCEPDIYFTTKGHPSDFFIFFSLLLLYVK